MVDLKLENYVGLIEGELVLGEFFLKRNIIDSAKYYFNVGEIHANIIGDKYPLLRIYEAKAQLFSEAGEYKKANEYFAKALVAQKELAKETQTLELATLETTYDLQNKEKELSLLSLQKDNNEKTIALNQKTIAVQKNTLIILAVGFILLLIIIYVIYNKISYS